MCAMFGALFIWAIPGENKDIVVYMAGQVSGILTSSATSLAAASVNPLWKLPSTRLRPTTAQLRRRASNTSVRSILVRAARASACAFTGPPISALLCAGTSAHFAVGSSSPTQLCNSFSQIINRVIPNTYSLPLLPIPYIFIDTPIVGITYRRCLASNISKIS